jgi:hypothetical protein
MEPDKVGQTIGRLPPEEWLQGERHCISSRKADRRACRYGHVCTNESNTGESPSWEGNGSFGVVYREQKGVEAHWGKCKGITSIMRLTKSFWQSKLEFTLRFQQYIELIRTQDKHNAIAHAKKFMLPFKDTYPKEMMQVAGLLAISHGGRSSVYEVREPFAPSF